jgi:AcrR family transcriptional regulator
MPARPTEPRPAELTETLRERKKRLTRQLISDTATAMFFERGFDGFKVTEVAEACGVSEKTVYNYFPTKESLILDREEYLAQALRHALGPGAGGNSPVDAIVGVLDDEIAQMRSGLADFGDEATGLELFRRFTTMVEHTPSLRAASREMADRLARVAAEAMAERAGVSPDDPEPTIAGHALVALWRVQYEALRRETPTDTGAADVYARVAAEVRRAARLVDTGLWSFSAMVSGTGTRDQLATAAEAAARAGRQVATALRQARKLWHDAQQHAGRAGGADARDERWRETQREQVQRWREAQRAHQQEWRDARRRMQHEERDVARSERRAAARHGKR